MNTYKKIIGKIAGNIMVKKVTLVLCLFCIMLGFGGMTYGYFKGVVTGGPGKQITATTANLSIVFNDGDAFTVEDMFPGETATKTFTVTNNGDREAKYLINWNTLTNGMTDKTDWTYLMTSTNGGGSLSETQLPNSGTHINIATDIWIMPGVTQTYTITFKFKYEASANQNDNRGKTISGKLEVIEQITPKYTFAEQIKQYNSLANSPTTTPGRQVATTDEGLIKGPNDDSGGNTYYFRGNVQDNYVSFAGKTWRIVRINGDGTVRLILNGSTGNSSTSTWYWNESNTTMTFGVSLYYWSWNNSSFKSDVAIWYSSNIGNNNTYDSMVVTGMYCNDLSNTTVSSEEHFGAYSRLKNASTATPQFTCPENNSIRNLKVGLITADEVAFAGGVINTTNTNYYLYINGTFWTMSPGYWSGNSGHGLAVTSGTLGANVYWTQYKYIRPVINIKADVLATLDSQTNPGTSSNPYRVG